MTAERRRLLGYAYALLSASAFGTLAISGKYAYADGVSVPSQMGFRFGFSALGFATVLLLSRRTFPSLVHSLRLILLGAGILAAEVTLFFMGLSSPGMSAGLTETLFFIYPAWVVLISALLNRRLPSLSIAASAVVAVLGVALTAGDIGTAGLSGVAYLAIASVLYATYIALSGHWVRGIDPVVASGLMIFGAGTALVIRATLLGWQPPQSATGWTAVASSVVLGTFTAYGLLYLSLQYISAPVAAILATAEPLIAIVLGVVMLGERMTVVQAIGSAVILGAVVLLMWFESRIAPTEVDLPEIH